MARSIWSGVISFGLVSVPVSMYSATVEHEVSFHQFEKGTGDRIRYQRVNERTGKEVEYSDIVKGAEVSDGSFVMLDQDELDSVAPGRSRSLDIDTFVQLDEIDPIFFAKTYYLGPPDQETAKTYGLLRDAMARTNQAAIGSLVMRGKQYLVAVRADGDLLVLHTMYFADEVRDPKAEVDNLPRSAASGKELRMAEQLIDSMSGRWNPADYSDRYTERVKKLIKAKGKGREVKAAEDAPAPTNIVDLMSVLQRSVEAARGRRPAKPAASKTAPKKATTKKTAPKKTATKKAAAKKAPTRQAAAKKSPTKRATSTMPAAKKAAARNAS